MFGLNSSLRKFGWWTQSSKSLYLYTRPHNWKFSKKDCRNSIITYQVKFPRPKLTYYIQRLEMIFSSVTWKQNAHSALITLNYASNSQVDITGRGNCGFCCWILQNHVKITKNFQLLQNVEICLLWNPRKNRVYINQNKISVFFRN